MDEIAYINAMGLFDTDWYIAKYPDVAAAGLDPLSHWHNFGCRESRPPNAYFEPEWYLRRNPDIREANLNPLVHYGIYGDSEGRKPGPNFDPAWYRRTYALGPDSIALSH